MDSYATLTRPRKVYGSKPKGGYINSHTEKDKKVL